MPDAKQRAEDALGHIEAFELGALADIKAELRKLIGGEPAAPAGPAADDAADEAPAEPEAPAAAPPKPPAGS